MVTITTNSDYLYGGVNVTIMNVLNPDFGTTDGFVITTSYDGVTLDVTDTISLLGRTLSTTPKPNAITYLGMLFDPKNESETSD
jgi:histone deacetylase 6